jgi:hypothetical protein
LAKLEKQLGHRLMICLARDICSCRIVNCSQSQQTARFPSKIFYYFLPKNTPPLKSLGHSSKYWFISEWLMGTGGPLYIQFCRKSPSLPHIPRITHPYSGSVVTASINMELSEMTKTKTRIRPSMVVTSRAPDDAPTCNSDGGSPKMKPAFAWKPEHIVLLIGRQCEGTSRKKARS